jgi:hypothetical protein
MGFLEEEEKETTTRSRVFYLEFFHPYLMIFVVAFKKTYLTY